MADLLPIVDGQELPDELHELLRPGALVGEGNGRARLPRFFYRVDSWKVARETDLAPGFGLYEFLNVDLREHPRVRQFPRYVPLAVTVMAAHLALLRQRVETYVHVMANGGYRSPAHQGFRAGEAHAWGTAVDLYRIGDDFLDDGETLGRYRDAIQKTLPGLFVRPPSPNDDHLHLSLGRLALVPPSAAVPDL